MDATANEATDFIVRLGSALVATGAPVDLVEDILKDVSNRYNVSAGYSILPTGLIILGHEGTSIRASIASSDPATLRFDQTTDLFNLVDEARSGQIDPAQGIERLNAIEAEKRRAGFWLTVLGHVVLTVGLALLLNPSWRSVGVAALLGLLVGLMKLVAAPYRTLATLLPAVTAALVTSHCWCNWPFLCSASSSRRAWCTSRSRLACKRGAPRESERGHPGSVWRSSE